MKDWGVLPESLQDQLIAQQEKDRRYSEQNKIVMYSLVSFVVGFIFGLIF